MNFRPALVAILVCQIAWASPDAGAPVLVEAPKSSAPAPDGGVLDVPTVVPVSSAEQCAETTDGGCAPMLVGQRLSRGWWVSRPQMQKVGEKLVAQEQLVQERTRERDEARANEGGFSFQTLLITGVVGVAVGLAFGAYIVVKATERR